MDSEGHWYALDSPGLCFCQTLLDPATKEFVLKVGLEMIILQWKNLLITFFLNFFLS